VPVAPTLIFETLTGSRAYGLHQPDSDEDARGVLVGPPEWYFGFIAAPEQIAIDGDDRVHYEVGKFLRLATKANPSILEVLWTDPDDHRVVTPTGEKLLANRELFVTGRVRGSFGSYAQGQLRRIRSHRNWLLDPPQSKPTRAEFGLPEETVVAKDQLGAAESLLADGRFEEADVSSNFLELLRREKAYKAAQQRHSQYQSWARQRNPARAGLEAKFGYDTKHAMHLVRLLRMAHEILESGRVIVKRPDREELLAIKDGAWSYDELMDNCNGLSERIDVAHESSSLPADCDESAANRLCVELIEDVLRQS